MSFESLQSVAVEYGVDLKELLEKVNKARFLNFQHFTRNEIEVLKVALEFHL